MADLLDYTRYVSNPQTALERTLSRELEGEVRFDAGSRALYSTDASIYRVRPIGVVLPRTHADVARTVQIAADFRVPILPRGAGTGLAGQTVGRAVVIDFSKYLNRIEIDPGSRRAWVEPGAVLDHLNRAARPHGLQFAPDVATSARATIGGMMGNNSCGAHSIIYGKTIDHVEQLDVVLASGQLASLGPMDPDDPQDGGPTLAPMVRVLRELVARHRERIEQRFPALLRRVSGYNLDEFLRPPWNLARLAIGSEGTLAVTRAARLTLVPLPQRTALAVCSFEDMFEAFEAVPLMLEHGPSAVELADRTLLDLARGLPDYRAKAERFLDGATPGGMLGVEFYGSSEDALARQLTQLETALLDRGFKVRVQHVIDPGLQADFWTVRKAGLAILMGMRGDGKPIAFVEDTCVRTEDLAEYMRRFDQLVRSHGVDIAYYAHASVGLIHARPVINLKQAEGVRQLRSIAEKVAELVSEYGGVFTGEHGDGLARSEFIQQMYGPELTEAFGQIKGAFDPDGLLNPGKIVDPQPMDIDLRYDRSHYQPEDQPSIYSWREFGGLTRSVEMCNGNGLCRKVGSGTMCPSYMATREEMHSTRGRANLLREALGGALPDGLADATLLEALDLCLSCKGCLRECPSTVDMSKLKYEVMVRWHRANGTPLSTRMFTALPDLLRTVGPLAALGQPLSRLPGARWLMEKLFGIDRRRSLPRLQWRSLMSRVGPSGPPDGPPVALFVDTFTNYFEPEVGLAAIRVLTAAGCRVTPIAPGCCGRPALSKGIPGAGQRASALAEHLVAALGHDTDLVGLEPSCLLTFRDELPELVADDVGQKISGSSYLLDEYLVKLQPKLELGPLSQRRALVHGHCHQKALSDLDATREVLSWIPGLETELLDTGCCGMAGSFGYETEHFGLSKQIGELTLLPAVRAASADTLLIASGTSCRHQILDHTQRRALHVAEALAESLDSKVIPHHLRQIGEGEAPAEPRPR